MTVSFYINKNDLQELNYLDEHHGLLAYDKYRDKAIVIECFNSVDCIERALSDIYNKRVTRDSVPFAADVVEEIPLPTINLFIQVTIEYVKYNNIKEFLKF